MPTEDTDTEAGGQAEDTGDAGGEEPAEGASAEPQAKAEGKGSPGARDKRRGDRYREATAARETAERALAEVQSRYQSLESSFNEFRQQIERDKRDAQQSNASTETRQQVSSLRQQARNFLVQSAQEKDPSRAQQLLDKHDELMDKADDLRDEMRDNARWEKRRGEIRNDIPNPEYQREMSLLEAKYPAVMSSKKAMALADQHYVELVQSGTRQAGRATLEEAITWAGKVLGLGGRTNGNSQLSRQVYGGRGAGDGEQDEGDSSGGMTADDVKNSLPLRRMALASFNTDDPEVAYAKFAKLNNNADKKNRVRTG